MRIGIDATCWANPRGYGRFTRGLVNAMVEIDRKNEYLLFLDREKGGGYELPAGARHVNVKTKEAQSKAARAYGHRTMADVGRMSLAVTREGLDLFFSPSVFSYFPLVGNFRKIVTIHDTIAEIHPKLIFPTKTGRALWRLKVRLALLQADRIVTVSEYSRRDISRYFNLPEDRIAIIPDCVADIFRPVVHRATAQTLVADTHHFAPPYILYVGGFGPHKNVAGLIESFATIASQPAFCSFSLVLVGERMFETYCSEVADLDRLVERHHLGSRIRFLGFRPDTELVTLYQGAELVVLPSFREGYGLPAIEAVACGTPVIATCESPLAEVLGDAAVTIDPFDSLALTRAMESILGSASRLSKMRTAALEHPQLPRWQSSAARAMPVFAEEGSRAAGRC